MIRKVFFEGVIFLGKDLNDESAIQKPEGKAFHAEGIVSAKLLSQDTLSIGGQKIGPSGWSLGSGRWGLGESRM